MVQDTFSLYIQSVPDKKDTRQLISAMNNIALPVTWHTDGNVILILTIDKNVMVMMKLSRCSKVS